MTLSPVDRPLYRHPLFWPVTVLTFTAVGLLRFAYMYLDDVARGASGTLLPRLVEEGTGAYTSLPLFVGVVWLVWRVPLRAATWRRDLAVHALGALLYSVAHTSLLFLTRSALFPLLGLGAYDYGRMPVRYAMELGSDVLVYASFVAAVTLVRWSEELHHQKRRAAELESSLAQAELQSLRLQLQPHFLFNALNTISSAMYDEPEAADAMLGELSELLRLSLRTARTQEVTLATELHVLDRYLALMRARFGDAFRVTNDVPEALASAMVPSLVLQPLVENAARHGNLARLGHGAILVRARADATRLWLEVVDDGPGAEPGRDPVGMGLGLSVTASRLRLLYGEAGTLRLSHEADGFTVSLELPYHVGTMEEPIEPSAPDGGPVASTRPTHAHSHR
jgi:signal transduction histidine kinase